LLVELVIIFNNIITATRVTTIKITIFIDISIFIIMKMKYIIMKGEQKNLRILFQIVFVLIIIVILAVIIMNILGKVV